VLDKFDRGGIKAINPILKYLCTLHSDSPGGLKGGPSCGLPFSDTEDITFETTAIMEN
jgi:hypothetical protein